MMGSGNVGSICSAAPELSSRFWSHVIFEDVLSEEMKMTGAVFLAAADTGAG